MVSAIGTSGWFPAASVFAGAVRRYRVLKLRSWVMDQAALGRGGDEELVPGAGAGRQSQTYPKRVCLASRKSLSILLPSISDTRRRMSAFLPNSTAIPRLRTFGGRGGLVRA